MLIGLIASIFLNLCMLLLFTQLGSSQHKIIDRQTQYINSLEKQLKGLLR